MATTDVRDLANPGKVRIEALSDGVFAIAMTLLAFNLKAPENLTNPASAQELVQAIWDEGVIFLTFFFSFVTLGVYWIGHHNIFNGIEKTDRSVLWLNMHYLLFIAAVPFTTNLVDLYSNNQVAVSLFGANLILISVIQYSIWTYCERHEFLASWVSPAYSQLIKTRTAMVPLVALASNLISFWSPGWSTVVYLALLPLYAAPALMERNTEVVLSGDGQIKPFMGVRRPVSGESPKPAFKPFGQRRTASVTASTSGTSESS